MSPTMSARRRALPAALLSAGVLVSLAACAPTVTAGYGTCAPAFAVGETAGTVVAPGELGASAVVDFPKPLTVDETQIAVIADGEGDRVEAGETSLMTVSVFSAEDGSPLGYISSSLLRVTDGGLIRGAGLMAQCAREGSRVAAVGDASELLGEDLISGQGLPVEADDDVVLVADVGQTFLGKADGADRLPEAGFPAVALAPDGRHGITIPSGEAPTEARDAVLKQGDGDSVEAGDQIVAQYTAVDWESGELLESSWEAGTAAPLLLDEGSTAVPPALVDALVGTQVGSQIIAILPPAEDAAAQPGGAAGTQVYVVDILGIV